MHVDGRVDAEHVLARPIRLDHGGAELHADVVGDGALARGDDSADAHEHRLQERATARGQGEGEVASRPGVGPRPQRVVGALVRREEHRDLRAHVGSVALVEVDDLVEIEVVALACVAGEQPLGEVDVPVPRQVHRQEREVGAHVGEPEAVVELDAVDDRRALAVQVNVLEPQVAVSVANPLRVDARLQDVGVLADEGALLHLDLARLRRLHVPRDVAARLGEVLEDVRLDRRGSSEARRLGVASCRRVEGRDLARDGVDALPT